MMIKKRFTEIVSQSHRFTWKISLLTKSEQGIDLEKRRRQE